MLKLVGLGLIFMSCMATAAPQSVEDEGLLWLAQELSVIRNASHQMQIRKVQGAYTAFDYDALQLDLTRMIIEIKSKVHEQRNPAYQYTPLEVESGGY